MEAIAITHPGIEQVTEQEIKEIVKPKGTSTEESVVFFEPKQLLDLCRLCYRAQSVIKILLLKKRLSFKRPDEIFSAVKKIDFSDFLEGSTFKVKCMRIGSHDFTSNDIEQGCGEQIQGKVDLDEPDVIVYVYIYNSACYIGIDFSGFDLSKRQYRIFHYKDALKATVAYALLRIAGYSKKDFLLDPFCSTATIPIEAALYATGFPVNHFSKDRFSFLGFRCFKDMDFDEFFGSIDKKADLKSKTQIQGYDALLGYVKAGQKNAKIAGINKKISITRADIEWLDTKVKKSSVDRIVTHVPQITERNRKNMEKNYKEFFHQAEFILKKKGVVLLACESEQAKDLLKKHASDYKFKVKKDVRVMQGGKELIIIMFQ